MQPYPVTINATISAKKGDSQPLTLAIAQSRPYPDTEGHSGRMRWRNLDTLDPSPYRNAGKPRLGLAFNICLLRSDLCAAAGDRRDHAGYEGNPGSLIYRGESLGELTATVQLAELGRWERVSWSAGGAAGKWLSENLDSLVISAIKDNLAKLHAHAIACVAATMAEQVRRLRESADALEAEAASIIGAVEAPKD